MEVVSGAIGQTEHIVAMLIMLMTTGSINGTVTVCNGINYIMIGIVLEKLIIYES